MMRGWADAHKIIQAICQYAQESSKICVGRAQKAMISHSIRSILAVTHLLRDQIHD